jgi:two-component system NarL family response regulator
MMALKIMIADDHPLLVDGVRRVLEEMKDVEVVKTVSNGRQLMAGLRQRAVDLVVLDLHMPQMDGIETLKLLRTEFPHLKVIVYTSYNDPKLIREVRGMGVRGYLLKSSGSVVVKEAVATVAEGGSWFQEEAPVVPSSNLVDDFMRKYSITSREVEILRKIAEGYTTREIGEQLFVSEFTVNAHRRNICRKLDINTPVGLVKFAKEHGIV